MSSTSSVDGAFYDVAYEITHARCWENSTMINNHKLEAIIFEDF